MDQQNPAADPISNAAATTSAVSVTHAAPQLQPPPQSEPPPPHSQPQPQPPSSASVTPPIPTPLPPSSNPNPVPNHNPSPRAPTPLPHQHSQSLTQPSRPLATLPRPWQPPHLTPSSSSAGISPSSSSLSSPPLPPTSAPPSPRGGVALGVPAHRSSLSPSQPPPFSPSYGHFGGLVRGGVNLPESSPNSSASQARPSMQGVQGMGMLGSLSSSTQMRPGGVPLHHQQRPVQSSLRPVSSTGNQLPSSQNYQGHGVLRVASAGSPGSPSPSTSQSVQSLNQPWLASGTQGKPPLPSPSYRQPLNPQSLQQRSHIQPQPQTQLKQQQQLQPPLQQQQQQQQQQPQSHPLAMSSQQHMSALQQQQPSQSQQTHEHYGKQVPPSRVPQALSHQQQITRVPALSIQKLSTPASVQPNTVQGVSQNRITTAETDETCNRILSKRSIHELVSQVDPSEKLDPEVEDILMDIADDFVESITTFGCSLAKHRKSTTLEAKDILLHLERNWNITLPGFGGDEIKSFRKPVVNDIHMERLVAIKKSMLATETAKTRNPSGQAAGNTKGSLAKTPTNIIGSPNVKI